MKIIEPTVGTWYKNLDDEQDFEVVAFEQDGTLIEIQFYEGAIEEIDLETWYELTLSEIAAPDDWSGAYEIDYDKPGHTDKVQSPENWSGPLNDIEPDTT